LIPQINLLGHQSWESQSGKLLEVYPQFDETPSILLSTEYKWPNADGLYCKSYCPQHPEVYKIIFDVVDEITNVFEAHVFRRYGRSFFILHILTVHAVAGVILRCCLLKKSCSFEIIWHKTVKIYGFGGPD